MGGISALEQIKLFVFLVPFVGVCWGCYKFNLPKKHRARQFSMPIIALLLSVYAFFKIQQLNDELFQLFDGALKAIDGVIDTNHSASPSQFLSELLSQKGAESEEFLQNLKGIQNNEAVQSLLQQHGIDPSSTEAIRGAMQNEDFVKNLMAELPSVPNNSDITLPSFEIPQGIKSFIRMVRSFMGNAFDLNLLISYILNFACAAAFLAIKGVLLPVINKACDWNDVLQYTVRSFYEPHEVKADYYDRYEKSKKSKKKDDNKKKNVNKKKGSEDDKEDKLVKEWFILPQMTSYHKLLWAGFFGVFVATIAVFLASVYHPEWAAFKAQFYPVFIVLIFGEVVAFLDGYEFEPEPEKVKPEEKKAPAVNPEYPKIWEELRTTYPDNMLRRNPDVLDQEAPQEAPKLDKDLSFLLNSGNENLKTISDYFKRFPEEEIEPSYVEGCVRLLQGKSVLFCNPFYEDLDKYLFPVIIYNLLSYKKCLFIMGRDSTAEDFQAWLHKGVKDFLGADGLWKTEIITEAPDNYDLGILKFSDIYNLDILNTNKDFFAQVGFVFILEPSRILATGQLALSLIVNQLDLAHCDKITYCTCDHNCDGLVDALSHALRTSITHVIATLPGNGFNLQIFWDADSQNMQYKILENVTHYLGIGTEISLVGMKHHVCNSLVPLKSSKERSKQNECWFACDKFPILDMMWIAGQYYHQICHYTGMEVGQEQFNKALEVRANIWHCPKADSTYLIVEDEYNNLFEMARIFSSRSLKEGFVNIISSHYLLRDYMINFIDLFLSDAKAIPTIVPDYARTERNVILKLLLMMTTFPLSEEFIRRELVLSGIFENIDYDLKGKPSSSNRKDSIDDHTDLYNKFCALIRKHITDSSNENERIELKRVAIERTLEDGISVQYDPHYEIREDNHIINNCIKNLKNAYFICEDELTDKHYISAKLYGHVLQCYLPGQFITMEGKYYQVVSISDKNGIVLRRAADHIDKRLYYRQIRDIVLKSWTPDESVGACIKIELQSGMKLTVEHGFADYEVQTPGYLECAPYNDIKHARLFELEDIPVRNYHYKNVLRLKLPEISQNVIEYKLNDIQTIELAEMQALKDKCQAVDRKIELALNQKMSEELDQHRARELQNKAIEEAERLKKEIMSKSVSNLAPAIKLKNALLKCCAIENENNESNDQNNDKTIEEIFNSLNNAETLEKVRFTICLILNEIFKTTYPESWQYINVVTKIDSEISDNLKNANYHLKYHALFQGGVDEECVDQPDNSADLDSKADNDVDSSEITDGVAVAEIELLPESQETSLEEVAEKAGVEATIIECEAPIQSSAKVESAPNGAEDVAGVSPEPQMGSAKTDVLKELASNLLDDGDEDHELNETDLIAELTRDSKESVSIPSNSEPLLNAPAKDDVTSDKHLDAQGNDMSADVDKDTAVDIANDQADDVVLDWATRGKLEKAASPIYKPGEALRSLIVKTAAQEKPADVFDISVQPFDINIPRAVPKQNTSMSYILNSPNMDAPAMMNKVAEDQTASSRSNDFDEKLADNREDNNVNLAENGVSSEEITKENVSKQEYIYVLEDSEIDLGLTVSIERYMDRYFEIIYDFLVWHVQKMSESNSGNATVSDLEVDLSLPEPPVSVEDDESNEEQGIIQRIIQFFKNLFGSKDEAPVKKSDSHQAPETKPDTPLPPPNQDYASNCFLKYGDVKFDRALAVKETIAYLGLLGYDSNRLDKARAKADETRLKKEAEAQTIAQKNKEAVESESNVAS